MGQFLTDKYLKYRAALRGLPIPDDKPCEYCGYNLRGLRYSMVCPECGTPIRYRRHADLPFQELPLPLIKGFRASCWMATVAIAGLPGLWLTWVLYIRTYVGFALVLVVLALWLTAAWRLTRALDLPQAIAHGLSARSWLRNAARWLQVGWAVAAGAELARWLPVGAGLATPLNGLVLCGILAGMVGLGAMAIFLARFAEWVGAEFAARAFRFAVWGTVIMGVAAMLVPAIILPIGGLTFFFFPLIMVPIAILAAAIGAFPVGLFALSRSVDWSAFHARDQAARDRRLHERLVTPRSSHSPLPPSTGPIRLAPPTPDQPQGPTSPFGPASP